MVPLALIHSTSRGSGSLSGPRLRSNAYAFGLLHDSCCSFSNDVQHKLGLRQHGDMTAVGFEDRCPHALCDEALQLGLDGLVLGGYDVPATRASVPAAVMTDPP